MANGNLLIPTRQASWGEVLHIAQGMFERKVKKDAATRLIRQGKLAEVYNKRKYIDETLGQHVMTLTKEEYWRILAKDRHFFDDPKNIDKLMRDNPEIKRRKPVNYRGKNFSFAGDGRAV